MSENDRERATQPQARRVKGHKATATCCIASRDTPGLVLTAGEDGCVCWFEMRCKEDVVQTIQVAQQPISSLCFNPGNEHVVYVSSGTQVRSFDVRSPASWKPMETYEYNKEEINQVEREDNDDIACNFKSSFLAAPDDGGDVKIIDINQKCLYKTLRAGHTSICSSVQFVPWRPWEVISGGLDSKLVMWDFSKGRPSKTMDFSLPDKSDSSTSQCYNPAFIHSISVPDTEMLDKTGKVCAVARGDGVVDVIDIESELAAIKAKVSSGSQRESQNRQRNKSKTTEAQEQSGRKRLHLDYSFGGHTAAVSCVAFSQFGERGKFIISGANDKSVKVWDWSRYLDSEGSKSSTDVLRLNIDMSKKVNWLCTTPTESENLVVCDTTKVVKVYSVF